MSKPLPSHLIGHDAVAVMVWAGAIVLVFVIFLLYRLTKIPAG